MRQEQAVDLIRYLGKRPSGDPWSQLKRFDFGRASNRDLAESVLGWLGVAPPDQREVEAHPDIEQVGPSYGLFSHQNEAADRIALKLYHGERRVVLHMPTGSGKTRTAMHVICRHLLRARPAVVVWLAYNDELCNQAAVEFERAWGSLGNREVTLARFWGRQGAEVLDITDGLIVAGLSKTYQKAVNDTQFIANLGHNTSMVVIDEAHQAVAPTYELLLDLLQLNPTSSLLGLTATPGRTWDEWDEDRKLTEFFANQKVTLQVPGYENPVDFLVEEGYLAKPRFYPLLAKGGAELSEADLRRIRDSLDVPTSVLEKLGGDEQRNLIIVRKVEALCSRHTRIIVFAPSVGNAEMLTAVLEARGIVSARCVTGSTPMYERQRSIRWYMSKGEGSRVLCNYGVLTTGFDAPRTSAVLIARPTKSLVLYSQMVGRGIRGVRAGGNDSAEIVTIIDQGLPGFGNMAEAFTNWEDTGWDTM